MDRREKIFKIWIHILAAFTVTNNDYRGRFKLRPDKYRLHWEYEFKPDLEKLVTSLGFVDVWGTVPPGDVYTHYTSHGAAQLDGLNVTWHVIGQKVGMETVNE